MAAWRTRLDAAAQERARARIGRATGPWLEAALVRAEPSAVVVNAPGHDLRSGEDARLRFEWEGASVHLAGTVLRVGLQVPDRGPGGLLVGLLRPTPETPDPRPAASGRAPVLAVRLSGDRQVSLLEAPVRVLELTPRRVVFEVPRSWTFVFPDQGTLWLRLGVDRDHAIEIQGRVVAAGGGDAVLVYGVELEEVADRERHQEALVIVGAALGLWRTE